MLRQARVNRLHILDPDTGAATLIGLTGVEGVTDMSLRVLG
jgi:hypothetical protein